MLEINTKILPVNNHNSALLNQCVLPSMRPLMGFQIGVKQSKFAVDKKRITIPLKQHLIENSLYT